MTATVLQWVSIVTGALAALFWLISALVPIPEFRVPHYRRGEGVTRPPHEKALKRQGIFSTIAAAFAVVAAIAAAALFLSTVNSN